jgi:hypothetical protein
MSASNHWINGRVVAVLACAWVGALAACTRGEPASAAGAAAPGATAQATGPVREIARSRVRVVWVQHDGSDPLAQSAGLVLMGLDTDDGRGERAILAAPANYTKPLLTPGGGQIIFSRRPTTDIHIVNWDGTGARRLADGFALAVWTDPASGHVLLYAGRDRVDDAYRRVVRFPIDRPDRVEVVWDKSLVGEDSFQLSRNGRWASGMFPWPEVGVVELPNGALRRLGEGCWTALAASDRPLCWYLDGAHRNLTLVDVEQDRRWRVTISAAPGFDGAEVYHPRWLSDPRLFAITGPYNLGGDNQVRGGGPQVEVYLGRFSGDFSRVEAWARVTNNARADAYPDVWIDPAGRPAAGDSMSQFSKTPTTPAPGPTAQDRVVMEARLVTPGRIPSPRAILPYRHALVVSVYDVLRVAEGQYAQTSILVAEWSIRDGRVLAEARRARGSVRTLWLDPYDSHPELEGERLVMDPGLPQGMPVYYLVR